MPGLEDLRGVLPFGLDLSPDESKLYVACAGLNAVAVVDTARAQAGGLHSGRLVLRVRAQLRDGRELFIASAKGVGSGPNGGRGFVPPERGSHPGDIMQGLLQRVAVPDRGTTRQPIRGRSIDNTYRAEKSSTTAGIRCRRPPGLRNSPIKHVVFIVKENRTFDQVYGERAGRRRRPDAGRPGTQRHGAQQEAGNGVRRQRDAQSPGPGRPVRHQRQLLLRRRSVEHGPSLGRGRLSERMGRGERPLADRGAAVQFRAGPPLRQRLERHGACPRTTTRPARCGSTWIEHKISFFNFGFGTEMPMSLEEQIHKHTGVQMSVSFPLPKPLFDNTSRNYPTFNMNIPDQYRADVFEQEFRERWASGKEPFPRLITMVLPNDHLAGERPEAGYPFRESYMADNDLALGRVVQLLSHTPYWKNMLIIVTEDDPQGGRDHVDAHRSLLLLIGPHVKRHYVSIELMNFGSVLKMIFTLLDLAVLEPVRRRGLAAARLFHRQAGPRAL